MPPAKTRETYFGSLLQRYRERRGWSVVDLEREAADKGYPITSFGRYELGQRSPNGELLYILQRVIGLTDNEVEALSAMCARDEENKIV